jgi:hypothetical protein
MIVDCEFIAIIFVESPFGRNPDKPFPVLVDLVDEAIGKPIVCCIKFLGLGQTYIGE